jgi:Tfp pilus assembly protein PilF
LSRKATKWPVECYFNRAIRFAPDDAAVRATYGTYLLALGKTDDAVGMFADAVGMAPEDPTINYNAGLAYFKKKDYAKAREHAKKAYALGFPLPGLKNKLVEAGKWDEPAQ